MQQTMKHEKTLPNGTAPVSTAFIAGGHCSTKMYIAPSKSACMAEEVQEEEHGGDGGGGGSSW